MVPMAALPQPPNTKTALPNQLVRAGKNARGVHSFYFADNPYTNFPLTPTKVPTHVCLQIMSEKLQILVEVNFINIIYR